MNIIPVLDLMNGQVVHAKHGDRQHYLPIQSALTASSQPVAVVQALCSLYPFKQLYIADINAIQKTGHHHAIIAQISQQFPQLEIWLDAGFSEADEVITWQAGNIRLVLASESLSDISQYQTLLKACKNQAVLSLDFKKSEFLGDAALLKQSGVWPKDVIVMSLDKVGSGQGPDFAQLVHIQQKSPSTNVYAAGGLRSNKDLTELTAAGIAGVLVASALHSGAISLSQF